MSYHTQRHHVFPKCLKCERPELIFSGSEIGFDICRDCWIAGATKSIVDHIRACSNGCMSKRGSLVAGCDMGIKLLDAYFKTLSR